ncbi:hypothetical protein OS493_019798 [Desmophyllum pertusum]|uniref:Uncharacterized protein n=1 Tax=Desmophyllum pertusum TaxID=174260 RepID=A0A9W9Z298_9CNID|nr:hypothetical protein OS493_019798 [Desmophyllum pertusum]
MIKGKPPSNLPNIYCLATNASQFFDADASKYSEKNVIRKYLLHWPNYPVSRDSFTDRRLKEGKQPQIARPRRQKLPLNSQLILRFTEVLNQKIFNFLAYPVSRGDPEARVYFISEKGNYRRSRSTVQKLPFSQFILRFTEPKEMAIKELSHETVEELCAALENAPTVDWKVLMKSAGWFRYSEGDVTVIETSSKSGHPAKVFLEDLKHREITLQDLVTGLRGIGNNKAITIIMKGAEKSGIDIQYSGGRPPPRCSTGRRPQEHSSFSRIQPIQRKEKAETLERLPVQESVATEGAGHPSNPGFGTVTSLVAKLFPCF